MSDLIKQLRPILLAALAADSAYVHDLDDEGRALAAERGEPYTEVQGVIVDGVIDPDKVLTAVMKVAAAELSRLKGHWKAP